MSCTICNSTTEDHSSALGCVEALQQQRDELAAVLRVLATWGSAPLTRVDMQRFCRAALDRLEL